MSLEILAYEDTPLGLLCLRRRELLSRPGTMVTEVTLNHEFLMSSYLTQSERDLTTFGLELKKQTDSANQHPLRVMVGGLGLGYTAAEALKSQSVGSVEVVEFLPQVIQWMSDGLVPLSETLNSDSRLTITQADVYGVLSGPAPANLFDLIIIDVDHSPEDVLGDQSSGFYTTDGLQKVGQHLATGGVLGVWSYARDTPLLENMKVVFEDVRVEQVTVENDLINEMQTDWLFFGRKAQR